MISLYSQLKGRLFRVKVKLHGRRGYLQKNPDGNPFPMSKALILLTMLITTFIIIIISNFVIVANIFRDDYYYCFVY